MEISKKLNIYKKEVGDKFYAEEVNQMVDAINDNYNQIEILKNKSIFNVDQITTNTIVGNQITARDNLQIDKWISNTIGDTFTLKGNGVVADYTLLTDQDLGDYAKKDDTNQIIKASSVEVNDGGVKFYTTIDSLNSTVSNLIGDFDQDRMPYLDFQGDEGNPRLTNIADPINSADAATKWYVDQRAVTDWKYETTIEWDGTNTIKDYSYNFPKSVKEIFIVGYTTYNSGNKGAVDIYFALTSQPASKPTRRVYNVGTTFSHQFVHIHKLGGEYYSDVSITNNPLVNSQLYRSQVNSTTTPTSLNQKIRSIKIKITTDIVRPTGDGQKWYIYSK